MVNLPANPGEALWVGSAAGKNHYNVGIGGPGGTLDHANYSMSQIEGGFTLDDRFCLNGSGDVQFKMYVEYGHTSSGTKYARSELRELTISGGNMAFDATTGEHYMKGRSRIDHAAPPKPWVCFFQVHDASSDLCRVQLEDGQIVAWRTPPGSSSEIRTVLLSSYTLGTWLDWEMHFSPPGKSGHFVITINGNVVLDVTGMAESGLYFKAGCYNQVSDAAAGGGATPGDYCQVTMAAGSFVTWHSGYASPTAPVFTGGAGGGGADTTPPTAPTNLQTTPQANGVLLTWGESTDNVGVTGYRVYRYNPSGGSGSTASFGKTDDGASSSASSADKLIASQATATTSGTLTAGHARLWMDSGSTTAKMCCYADAGGTPGALLATSDQITVSNTSETVKDFTFTGGQQIPITSGTVYWIGVTWKDPGTPNINFSRNSLASNRVEASGYTYPSLPNPFGTASSLSGPIDAYLDVTTAGGSGGYTLLATVTGTSYLDTSVTTTGTQTRGVGGIPAPAAGPNAVLYTADQTARLKITQSGTSGAPIVHDGGGHSVPGITITADNVTVQNFVIHNAGHDGVNATGNNITVQNCDYYDIYDDGTGDINGNTVFGDNIHILANTAGVTGFMARDPVGGSHTDFVQTWNTSSKRSTSGLIVQNNRIDGPATSDDRFIHQIVQGEGKGSTDGGGGGTGVSQNWLIADNVINAPQVNQAINLLDIHQVDITRNAFNGSASKRVGTGDGTDNVRYWTDNTGSGSYGSIGVSTTSGSGPAGVTSAAPAPTYTYKVTAIDAAGNESGGGGAGGAAGAPDTSPPTVPTNLAGLAGDARAVLTWDAATDNVGVTRYRIYRGGTALASVAAPSTSMVDVDVINGASYSYTVSALDAAGNESAQSGAVTVTPAAPPVVGVSLLPLQLGAAHIAVEIAWGADLAADEATWTWTDITADVRHDPGITTMLGRNDESSRSNPANLTLTLDNASGAYSLGGRSPNYPNVRRNTPVRVRIDPADGHGGRVVLFGFADGFTPGWDSLTGTAPVVTLSASGTLRRLGQGSAPVISAYRRAMLTAPAVAAYWPLEEGKSATYAPGYRGAGDMALVGTPDWGSDSSIDCSAALPVLKTGHLTGKVGPYVDAGVAQVRFLLACPQNGLADGTVLLRVACAGTVARWDVSYEVADNGKCIGLQPYDSSGAALGATALLLAAPDDNPGLVSLSWQAGGSDTAWTLGYVPVATGDSEGIFLTGTIAGKTPGAVTQVECNPLAASVDAAIGHVTVETAISSLFASASALVAHRGEVATGADGRMVRLCTENQVPLASYGSGAVLGVLDRMGPQLVAPLLDLLHECETSDQGQLWDGRGAGLAYSTRRYRELGTVRLTVSATGGDLAHGFAPVDDDQRNRNHVTATIVHGVSATAEDFEGPLGVGAIGMYDDSVTVNNANDAMATQYAEWLVHLGTVQGYRYPSVTVDLAVSPALAAAVLDVIPGGRIDVTGLDETLAQFPSATVSLIVEGIRHEISPVSWRVTFLCSPFSPWGVGAIAAETGDTSDMAIRVDTDGAAVASNAAAAATSLSVATSKGALWTTASDDYPLYLDVGGMRVRATACSGTSSPQTFTVDPLPAARTAGQVVALWDPRVVGLG